MSRRRREEIPGAVYHVGARGSCKQSIYEDDHDRFAFLYRLERISSRYRWLCLTYCLMTNHFHVILLIPDGGLSAGMQELLSGYSRATNKRHGRCDHLFKQHFFSEPLERESHFLEACRYVVLNPVRAGLCDEPGAWAWSSYRACAGLEFGPDFLAVGRLLEFYADDPAVARRRYCEFVAAAPGAVSDTVTEASRTKPYGAA